MSVPKRALVVGGTSGIGQGIALALAKRQYVVTVAGRSEKGVVAELPGENHSFVAIDAFDLSSVRRVAEETPDIDVLVMTQGMASVQGYTATGDGLDQKLQLHYFSRVYMARLLAAGMKDGSRILTVLSAGVHGRYSGFESDFELKDRYGVKNAADAAGFYTDAAFEKVAAEAPGVCVAHACPGFVNTRWGTEMPWVLRAAIRPLQAMFGKSSAACGEALTKGLLELPESGFHLIGQHGAALDKGKAIRHTPVEGETIWRKTLALLPDVGNSG